MTAADYHCFGCRRCNPCNTSVCLDVDPAAQCDHCGGVTCDRCTHECVQEPPC